MPGRLACLRAGMWKTGPEFDGTGPWKQRTGLGTGYPQKPLRRQLKVRVRVLSLKDSPVAQAADETGIWSVDAKAEEDSHSGVQELL